jgi:hypothetical protein
MSKTVALGAGARSGADAGGGRDATPSLPGNVRGLRNVMERAVILSRAGCIGTEHLLLSDRPRVSFVPASEPRRPPTEALDGAQRHAPHVLHQPEPVGDETDGQVVHAGVAGERTVGQVGQLPVVAARKVLADVSDVVPDDVDVEVVEQPLPAGPMSSADA